MSDIKHLEYCVKLGNTIIQNKLEGLGEGNYENIVNTYSQGQNNNVDMSTYEPPKRNEDIINFRARLQGWKK